MNQPEIMPEKLKFYPIKTNRSYPNNDFRYCLLCYLQSYDSLMLDQCPKTCVKDMAPVAAAPTATAAATAIALHFLATATCWGTSASAANFGNFLRTPAEDIPNDFWRM
jgi:hypothetical protein